MRGHVRKRGARWAIVYDEGRDEHGRRRQRWVGGFATKREAQEALTKTLGSIHHGEYVSPERMPYRAFALDVWMPTVETMMRPTTVEAYRRNLTKHVIPALGGTPVQKITATQLDHLYRRLLAGGGEQRPLSPRTVRFIAAVISSSLDFAKRKHIVTRNVARDSDPPVAGRRKPTVWTARETSVFLEHVDDDPLAALWRVYALTGVRRGEALGLTWLSVDFAKGTASVSQQVTPVGGHTIIQEPKTHESNRMLYLDEETVGSLREHRERQKLERDLVDPGYQDHDLVFAQPDGPPLDPRWVSVRFQTLRKAAGLPRIRLHDLRHGMATLALQAEIPAEIVRRRLGHSNIHMTLATYSHAVPGLEADAAERIAAGFRS